MKQIDTDLCVIGAGSGGLSVAAGAVQMGVRTVLIEGAEMGGDCLNFGCVPSKTLIAAADHAHARTQGAAYGVTSDAARIDYARAKDRVAEVIAAIAPMDSQDRFEGLGCTVIRDWARFESPDTVVAAGRAVRARRFVIATGSSPAIPPIEGIDTVPVLTNETVFALRERPERLLIIGGGPIGIEMAQAHARLGCEVTVIEARRALAHEDHEAARTVLDRVRAEGVRIVETAKVSRVGGSAGDIRVETSAGTYDGTHLLVAAGRKVNIDRLDLRAGRVAHDRGVKVDDQLRSVSNHRVYAVGDAVGGQQFTHLAGYHAGVVVRAVALGLPATARTDHVPRVTYTRPELAHVGLTEAEARSKYGGRLEVLRTDYDDNDRALASGETTGHLKVMVAGGRPVGATIVHDRAGELIGLWSMALANKLKLKAISDTILPYPTLNEASKRAAGTYFASRLFDNQWVTRAVRTVQRLGR